MNEAQQIKKCQATPRYTGHTMDYIAGYEYHERRQKRGDRQVFCKTCQLWKFATPAAGCTGDVLCCLAVTVEPGRCIRCEQRRPAKEEALCRRCIAELEAAELEGSTT